MQLDDLYSLTGLMTDGAEQLFGIRLNAAHPLFAGHFPGQPVLPGVCTLAIVRHCIACAEKHPIRFTEIRECKFTAAVDPRVTQLLEVRLTTVDGAVQGTVTDPDRTILKIKAKYTRTDD